MIEKNTNIDTGDWESTLASPKPPDSLEQLNVPACQLRIEFKSDNPHGNIESHFSGALAKQEDIFERQFLKLDLREFSLFVFDCDGLLFDSEKVTLECIILAAQQLVRENKHEEKFVFSSDQVKQIQDSCFKRSEPDMASRLKSILKAFELISSDIAELPDAEFLQKLVELRVKIYSDKVDNGEVQLMPGAIELLTQLQKFNVTCAFNTGNSHRFIEILVNKLVKPQIEDFDLFIPENNRVYGANLRAELTKPNPFSCTQVCQRLAIDPSRAVMFEDRLSGVNSAFGAGYGMSVIIPENQDPRPFTSSQIPTSIPNPNRFHIVPGLDRICLISPDNQVWYPEGYYKQKELWQSFGMLENCSGD